eukprot:NODE_263_length_1729_cov_301.250896.p1 GENE.NODE_263_length_1729_cov_301.250896~~NODE_263_length_1729_cov_301.250896.p1  ORF type:complete len:455 (-),score=162.61 NODE_263_length_1729_cov_301.250896:347-1711(-)
MGAMMWHLKDQSGEAIYRYDIGIAVADDAHIFSDGLTEKDLKTAANKHLLSPVSERQIHEEAIEVAERRARSFPASRIVPKALDTHIAKAQASRDQDRKQILNTVSQLDIVNVGIMDLDTEPPENCLAYREVDQRLHALFAAAFWPFALDRRLQKSMAQALSADKWRTKLKLKAPSGGELPGEGDLVAGAICRFSDNLTRLELDYSDAKSETIVQLDDLGHKLEGLVNLAHLSLDLRGCWVMQLDGFAKSLATLKNLLELKLVFEDSALREVDKLGQALGELLSLRELVIDLTRCMLSQVNELGRGLEDLSNLTILDLNFEGVEELTQVDDLGRSLRGLGSLVELRLNFRNCESLFQINELGRNLPALENLKILELNFQSCMHLRNVEELWQGLHGTRSLRSMTLLYAQQRLVWKGARTCAKAALGAGWKIDDDKEIGCITCDLEDVDDEPGSP